MTSLIIDVRDHIGGNCYDYIDSHGIRASKCSHAHSPTRTALMYPHTPVHAPPRVHIPGVWACLLLQVRCTFVPHEVRESLGLREPVLKMAAV